MTATAADTAPFWDRAARKYAAQPIANPAAYATTLERTRHYLKPSDRVLEIGAGTSSTAITLAPLVAHYTASDVSGEMVRIGQEKARAAGIDNLDIRQGVLGDAELGDGPFDAILAYNLLHLCRDPGAVARAAQERLRPGGYFISKSACLASGQWYLWPVIALMRLVGRAPYVNFFTSAWLEGQLRDAGFEIVESGVHGTRFIVARKL